MFQKILMVALLLTVSTGVFATKYYTVDVGNGTEWSVDGVTPCNCLPQGDGEGDELIIRHNYTFQFNTYTFKGKMVIESDSTLISGALTIDNAVVEVNNGAFIGLIGALVSNESEIFLIGNMSLAGSVTFNETRIIGIGKLDLTNASCTSYLSSLNGLSMSNTICGQVQTMSTINLNVWNGTSWSFGSVPNSCNENVLLSADYNTADGNILAGKLFISSQTLTIAEGTNIDVCDYLINMGNVIVENKGSLVQRTGSRLYNTGNFQVLREGQHNEFKYNIWSSPVVGSEHLSVIYPNTNPCDMFVFNAETQAWTYDYEIGYQTICNGNPVTFTANDVIPGGDGIMDKAIGYFVPGPQSTSSIVREFNGEVNNGEISVNITTSSIGGNTYWYGDDWNLVGNPYPSSIDGFKFWEINAEKQPSISDGIYIWVENTKPPYDQFNSYLVWNPIGATYIDGDSEPFDGVVPACSGFWVTAVNKGGQGQGNVNSVKELLFTNEMRLTNGLSLSQQDELKTASNENERQRAWITLTTDSNNYDQILIGTHPKATDTIDYLYDARYNPGSSKVFLASVNQGIPFTIQGFAPILGIDTVYIGLMIGTVDASQHYLTFDSTLYYTGTKDLYLVDSVLNTTTPFVLKQPIPIQLDSAGVYRNRFYIKVVSRSPLGVKESVTHEFDGRVWANQKIIFFDNFRYNVKTVEVFNMIGQRVLLRNVNSRNSNVEVPNIESGIFIVKMTDNENRTVSKKVYLK